MHGLQGMPRVSAENEALIGLTKQLVFGGVTTSGRRGGTGRRMFSGAGWMREKEVK